MRKQEIGNRYGKWTVVEYSHTKHVAEYGRDRWSATACWKVQCSCGNTSIVEGTSLRRGTSTQCKVCSNRINGKKGHNPKKDLYMVQCGPYVKIGTTSNIKQRLVSLRVYNPYPIKLIGYWEDYGYMEKSWHESLKHLHHHGEWYKLGACDLL